MSASPAALCALCRFMACLHAPCWRQQHHCWRGSACACPDTDSRLQKTLITCAPLIPFTPTDTTTAGVCSAALVAYVQLNNLLCATKAWQVRMLICSNHLPHAIPPSHPITLHNIAGMAIISPVSSALHALIHHDIVATMHQITLYVAGPDLLEPASASCQSHQPTDNRRTRSSGRIPPSRPATGGGHGFMRMYRFTRKLVMQQLADFYTTELAGLHITVKLRSFVDILTFMLCHHITLAAAIRELAACLMMW